MEDNKIIELYNQRSEIAIAETERKFGKMLYKIAYSILSNHEDSEETVSDTYEKAWETIPPEFPIMLGAWLGKITRNFAIGKYRRGRAQKRSGIEIMLSELEECVPSNSDTERESEEGEITAAINYWLESIGREERIVFVKRYWYGKTVSEIGEETGISPKKLSSKLFRLRKNLKEFLGKEGILL